MIRRWILAMIFLGLASAVQAHPLSPTLFQWNEQVAGRAELTWKAPLAKIPGEALSPELPSFCRYLGPAEQRQEKASLVLRRQVVCEGPLTGAEFGVAGLAESRTNVVLDLRLADGRQYQAVLNASAPRFTVPSQPAKWEVFRSYGRLGVEHILTGWDHLLFVFGLLLLVKGRRALLWTISAFTLGHSITLSLATLGIVRVPSEPMEALIALSIFWLAVELIRQPAVQGDFSHRFPWVMALLFGLLHGLGFAGALSEVGLPSGAVPLALAAFNLGIELGQLMFIAAILILGELAGRFVKIPAPAFLRTSAYLIGCLSAFWLIERSVQAWRSGSWPGQAPLMAFVGQLFGLTS